MAVDFPLFDNDHVVGDCAMRPIAPRLTRQAALIRLVGTSPQRCHALPGTPITAHSGAFNCGFQVQSITPAATNSGLPGPARKATNCCASAGCTLKASGAAV